MFYLGNKFQEQKLNDVILHQTAFIYDFDFSILLSFKTWYNKNPVLRMNEI